MVSYLITRDTIRFFQNLIDKACGIICRLVQNLVAIAA